MTMQKILEAIETENNQYFDELLNYQFELLIQPDNNEIVNEIAIHLEYIIGQSMLSEWIDYQHKTVDIITFMVKTKDGIIDYIDLHYSLNWIYDEFSDYFYRYFKDIPDIDIIKDNHGVLEIKF